MRHLIAALLCCAAFAAQAAGSHDLLDRVLAQLRRHPSVRAEFTQTRSNPALTRPQVSHGQLLFVLGRGLLWQVREPYRETLLLDGRRSARVGPGGRLQPLHGQQGVQQVSQMLQSMLGGNPAPISRQFDVQASGTPDAWTVHFVPKQARMARVLARIELDGHAYLQGIRIVMRDGGGTRIRFDDPREAGPLSALETRLLDRP